MVDFVKPKLLGTKKEFMNRFVNPILNGQCADSSAADVKVMKKRAHILHETLAGCVQVRREDFNSIGIEKACRRPWHSGRAQDYHVGGHRFESRSNRSGVGRRES